MKSFFSIISILIPIIFLLSSCNSSNSTELKFNKKIVNENYEIRIEYRKDLNEIIYIYKDETLTFDTDIQQARKELSDYCRKIVNTDITEQQVLIVKRIMAIKHASSDISHNFKHDDENLNDDYDAAEHIAVIVESANIKKKKL